MKKLTLLLAVVSFFCFGNANAQDGKGSINFVPYVGVNYSDFSGDADLCIGGTSGKVNLMAGARFEFQIADKSAIIADVNYRRLGATADAYVTYGYRALPGEVIPPEAGTIGVASVKYGNIDKEEIHRIVKENNGYVHEFTKVTFDCISFNVQLKQKVLCGLSIRAGLECIESFAEKWHYHEFDYHHYNESGKCDESYDDFDADDYFSNHIEVAIPLGVTYDYKNFSINATYHLPLTKCYKDKWGGDEYSLKHQAFDLTVGYRLPLRKR